MVDNMEHTYSLHGHTRSMSSLASTIVPLASEPSSMTSVSASPMESMHSPAIPIELKIPLPPSGNCSEDEDNCTQAGAIHEERPLNTVKESQKAAGPRVSSPIHHGGLIDMDAQSVAAKLNAISLDELASLVELEQYANRNFRSTCARLNELLLSTALARRLIHSSSLAYRSMVEQFRNKHHSGFTAFYQACEELVDDCVQDEHSRPSHDPYSGETEPNPEIPEDCSTSWIQSLSPTHQEDILGFLSKIRTDTSFLSDCLSRLSPLELQTLASSHQFSKSSDSIFQHYYQKHTRSIRKDRPTGMSATRIDALRELHKNDPFFSLLYCVFDDTSKYGSQEHHLRVDVWSTACARLLMENKQGSEDFTMVMLDVFGTFQDWKLKPHMEMFLIKLLNQGAFLLDPPQPTDFKQPVEISNAQAAVAVSNFFDNALKDLFVLLADEQLQFSVPATALDFAHSVLGKIYDPRIRLRTKTFMTTGWFFSSYLSNIINYPESQGIMMTYHIGDTARLNILKELTTRMQKQVVDITSPWNHVTIVTPDVQARVGQFLALFEPTPSESSLSPVPHDDETVWPSRLMLSPENVICLTNLFYSDLPSPSMYADSPCITNPSTASSLSGSSTLTYRSLDLGSTMASSLTPSVSGTLATNNTITGEVYTEVPQSPFLPLEHLSLKTEIVGSKSNLGHRMKAISKNLTETYVSEKDPASHRSSVVWTFIYITQNGKRLHLDQNTDSKPHRAILLDGESPTPNGIHWHDFHALKEAIRALLYHHDASRDLVKDTEAIAGKFGDISSLLKNRFESKMSSCNAEFEFANGLFWWKSIQLLQKISSDCHEPNYLNTLLGEIANNLKTNINSFDETTKRDSAWCHSLASLQKFQRQELFKFESTRKILRIKMWYVSDVRHSAPYEDALYVTRALRAMATSSRTKQPGSFANWARNRLRPSIGQDRLEAQTLEALVAHKDHGGLSKLGDDQVELTSRWLTKNSIENFCKGEERIHRFCFEIQKCVNKLAGMSLLESPVLWSSRLFGREKSAFDTRLSAARSYGSPYRNSNTRVYASNYTRFIFPQLPYPPTGPSLDNGFKSNTGMNPFCGIRNLAKAPVEPNVMFPISKAKLNNASVIASLHSSATQKSMTSSGDYIYPNVPEEVLHAKTSFTHQIKKILYSLFISDLGYLLWIQGSETDAWIKVQQGNETPLPSQPQHYQPVPAAVATRTQDDHQTTESKDSIHVHDKSGNFMSGSQENNKSETASALHGEASRPKVTADTATSPIYSGLQMSDTTGDGTNSSYPYSKAHKKLLDRLSFTPDPYIKLQILSELEILVLNPMHDSLSTRIITGSQEGDHDPHIAGSNLINSRHTNIPRTKATSLEEVIANCTERRAGTLTLGASTGSTMKMLSDPINPEAVNTDLMINGLLAIFRDPNLRPHTLYRDLQFIAAFIPSSILDQTPLGKSFWDAGLAALALKEDICASMIDRATKITTYHISASQPPLQTIDRISPNPTLRDAAHLWLLTAKEGSPLAARELALFYLIHPWLLPRVTLPLSKAKDVFRPIASGDHKGAGSSGGVGGGTGGGLGATGGLDALTFSVVFHWMELAANGGDPDARAFLRGNGELSGGR